MVDRCRMTAKNIYAKLFIIRDDIYAEYILKNFNINLKKKKPERIYATACTNT